MPKASRSQDVLQQLIQERRRYEEWLAALEGRRDSTPERVYGRVRKDYEDRLAGVLEQLGARTEELRAVIAKLAERMLDLERQETDRVDALHEVELRAAVGEYTPTQWEAMKAEAELDLKKLADDKKRTKAEHDQLQQILEQTRGSAGATAASAELASASTPEAPAEAPAPKRPTPARSRPAAKDDDAPDIRTLAPNAKGGETPRAADPRPEHEKTLKCQECGTLNYPTEWYCENCGGELSAL